MNETTTRTLTPKQIEKKITTLEARLVRAAESLDKAKEKFNNTKAELAITKADLRALKVPKPRTPKTSPAPTESVCS